MYSYSTSVMIYSKLIVKESKMMEVRKAGTTLLCPLLRSVRSVSVLASVLSACPEKEVKYTMSALPSLIEQRKNLPIQRVTLEAISVRLCLFQSSFLKIFIIFFLKLGQFLNQR